MQWIFRPMEFWKLGDTILEIRPYWINLRIIQEYGKIDLQIEEVFSIFGIQIEWMNVLKASSFLFAGGPNDENTKWMKQEIEDIVWNRWFLEKTKILTKFKKEVDRNETWWYYKRADAAEAKLSTTGKQIRAVKISQKNNFENK